MDVQHGHALLGQASFDSIVEGASKSSLENGEPGADVFFSYALHYGLAHLCLAGRVSLVEQLVLRINSLWQAAYAQGQWN